MAQLAHRTPATSTASNDSTDSTADAVIDARGVCVSLGGHHILREVDLTVAAGESVALLGPNGAGKTTLVDCLEGFRRPDAGSVSVLGRSPHRAPRVWKDQVGVILQDTKLDADLTVAEFASMTAAWYSNPVPVSEMLERVGLSSRAGRRVHRLSGGERRRLDLALALIGQPRVLFLDEPTTGLDPHARREIWTLIKKVRSEGTTVLLTSHDLQEVEELAERIVIIIDGRIRMDGTPEQLRAQHVGLPSISFVTGDIDLAEALGAEHDPATGRMVLTGPDVSTLVRQLRHTFGDNLLDVQVATPGFEQMYLDLLAGRTPNPTATKEEP